MKKKIVIFLLICTLSAALAGCGGGGEDPPVFSSNEIQLQGPSVGDTIAVFDTDLGVFKAVLYPQYAPKAVENFTTHAKNGYYNGVTFHRVMADFVVQSGDPTDTGGGGDSIWMIPFENEYSEALHHYRGALGMAAAVPDQNKSQFYIIKGGAVGDDAVAAMKSAGFSQGIVDAYLEVGGQPTLDFCYTIFGQVYDGLDIIDEINAVKTDSFNRPAEDILINSVTIDSYQNPVA